MDIKSFIKRDFVYIIVVLFALFACIFTLYNVSEYQQKCNAHWEEQFTLLQDKCPLINPDQVNPFNGSFEMVIPVVNEVLHDG